MRKPRYSAKTRSSAAIGHFVIRRSAGSSSVFRLASEKQIPNSVRAHINSNNYLNSRAEVDRKRRWIMRGCSGAFSLRAGSPPPCTQRARPRIVHDECAAVMKISWMLERYCRIHARHVEIPNLFAWYRCLDCAGNSKYLLGKYRWNIFLTLVRSCRLR